MIVAGETSGDLYAARVLESLSREATGVVAFGVGGAGLERAGLARLGDSHDLSIVGFTGVVTGLPRVARLYRRLVAALDAKRPHVLVCVDLPDFNALLALKARGRGIPALFVIGPQVWAWRPRRIERCAERIAKMIVAFPFEVPLYERAGVPVAFHGHPLVEVVGSGGESRERTLERFGLEPGRRTFVLAPGSRRSELAHHARPLLGAAARLHAAFPDWQLALPLAPGAPEGELRQLASSLGLPLVFTRGDNPDLFRAADFGLVCSGTATLEAALCGLPMLIFYRVNALDAALARLVVRIDRIGLPNIVLGGPAPTFPELLQRDVTAERLADSAAAIVRDEARLAELRGACARVRERLAGGDTSRAIAGEILALAHRAGPLPGVSEGTSAISPDR
jgi:lipid-A-disaccharide synthase